MKSLQRRFKIYQTKNPYLGDYVVLMKTVFFQKYSKETISRWFPKIMNTGEYDNCDKKRLIASLYEASNMSQEPRK